jgi:hypothetical protein
MNVEIGTVAGQFPEKEYISRIFVAVQAREYLTMECNAKAIPKHAMLASP